MGKYRVCNGKPTLPKSQESKCNGMIEIEEVGEEMRRSEVRKIVIGRAT